jgi:uncharacterized protein with HEPN domain
VKRDPRDYVEHVQESMAHIARWVAEGRDVFMTDVRTQAATMRKLHELSESLKRLHAVVGERYPELPWRAVIAFRDVIVHDYLGLNLDRIWEIATVQVPALSPHVERIAADLAEV